MSESERREREGGGGGVTVLLQLIMLALNQLSIHVMQNVCTMYFSGFIDLSVSKYIHKPGSTWLSEGGKLSPYRWRSAFLGINS